MYRSRICIPFHGETSYSREERNFVIDCTKLKLELKTVKIKD